MTNTLYERMLDESKRIDSMIKSIDSKLKTYPQSNFYCTTTNGKYFKWFKVDNNKSVYLPKSKRTIAEKLAIKKYLTAKKKDLVNEKQAIERYLNFHDRNVGEADKLFQNPAYQELIFPLFRPVAQELQAWSNESYERLSSYPEQLIHKTTSGILVRSKSEAIIETFLFINKIPFRYEAPLQIGNIIFHPDFTIRHPETGMFYYWEHFGMMDDFEYCNNCFSKLRQYCMHQIYPSINLITTFETKNHPLSPNDVEQIIKHYFLS